METRESRSSRVHDESRLKSRARCFHARSSAARVTKISIDIVSIRHMISGRRLNDLRIHSEDSCSSRSLGIVCSWTATMSLGVCYLSFKRYTAACSFPLLIGRRILSPVRNGNRETGWRDDFDGQFHSQVEIGNPCL
jgi:hypothetical protein